MGERGGRVHRANKRSDERTAGQERGGIANSGPKETRAVGCVSQLSVTGHRSVDLEGSDDMFGGGNGTTLHLARKGQHGERVSWIDCERMESRRKIGRHTRHANPDGNRS
jgi:hypothetical protein